MRLSLTLFGHPLLLETFFYSDAVTLLSSKFFLLVKLFLFTGFCQLFLSPLLPTEFCNQKVNQLLSLITETQRICFVNVLLQVQGHNLAYTDFIRYWGLESEHLVPQFHPKFNVLSPGLRAQGLGPSTVLYLCIPSQQPLVSSSV